VQSCKISSKLVYSAVNCAVNGYPDGEFVHLSVGNNEMKSPSPKIEFGSDKEALSMKLAAIGKKYFGVLTYSASDKTIDRYQSVFLVVVKSGGVSQQKLAHMIDVDKSTIVRMVDYLQEKGLVQRQVNPDDRREHIVVPTEKAHRVAHMMADDYIRVNDAAFKGFSASERELFYQMLDRIYQNLLPLPSDQYTIQYQKSEKQKDEK